MSTKHQTKNQSQRLFLRCMKSHHAVADFAAWDINHFLRAFFGVFFYYLRVSESRNARKNRAHISIYYNRRVYPITQPPTAGATKCNCCYMGHQYHPDTDQAAFTLEREGCDLCGRYTQCTINFFFFFLDSRRSLNCGHSHDF